MMTEAGDPHERDDEDAGAATGGELLEAVLDAAAPGRLDRALADALPQLSRARLRALMESGAVMSASASQMRATGRVLGSKNSRR